MWADAPVEMTILFHKRVSNFMDMLKSSHMLGRIQYWLVRYEAQGRGSLHAHILLWLHEDDLERVEHEIVAFIPGEINQGFARRPSGDREGKLYDLASRKQMHRC